MAAIFNSPSKYIQGPDELAKLGSYVEPLGAKALVIVTPSGKKRVGAKIEGGFTEAKAELLFEDFNGECSKGEVDRLVALARDNGCDIIVGVGGGKILDTAKEQDMDVAKRVSVQLQLTDPDLKSRDRVVKKSEKDSLYAAMDVGCIWLERALAGKL